MTIRTECPECAQHIEAPIEVTGAVVSCPNCSNEFRIDVKMAQVITLQIPTAPKKSAVQKVLLFSAFGCAVVIALLIASVGYLAVSSSKNRNSTSSSLDSSNAHAAATRTISPGPFDLAGKVSTEFGGEEDKANGIAVQTDGKIVVAGTSLVANSKSDFAVALL